MARILVVQEIAQNTSFVREALEGGHNIHAVSKVSEAREIIATNAIDLIICAVHLNHGDVFDLLMWLKRHEQYHKIPFVFFCAMPDEFARFVSPVVVSAAKVLGVADHITMENFDAGAFSKRIEAALLSDTHRLQTPVTPTREQVQSKERDRFEAARDLAQKKAAQDVG